MANLVAVTHPLTGKVLHMHPSLAAQTHHWIHPDPSVSTPPQSLPLFIGREVDALVAFVLTPAHPAASGLPDYPSTSPAAMLERLASGR